MIDAAAAAALGYVANELLHRGLVRLAESPRLGEELLAAFDVLEQHRILERQLDLFGIENLENQDLVALVLKAAQALVKNIEIEKQIGYDDDEAAALDLFGDLVHDSAELRRALRLGLLDDIDDLVELRLRRDRAEKDA